jgi:hypothetical protein
MVSKSKLKVNVMRHLQRINGLAMSLEMSDWQTRAIRRIFNFKTWIKRKIQNK